MLNEYDSKMDKIRECIFQISQHYYLLNDKIEQDYKNGILPPIDYEFLKSFGNIDCYASHLKSYCLSKLEAKILRKFNALTPTGEILWANFTDDTKQTNRKQECIFQISQHYYLLKDKIEKDYKNGILPPIDYEFLKSFGNIDCYASHLKSYCLSKLEAKILRKFNASTPTGEILWANFTDDIRKTI